MCAWNRPLSAPIQPSPNCTCGECGSPSSSACAWCLRWSATQSMTGPCTDIEPGDREAVLDRLVRLERAMGQQPVEADRHAEAGDEVHDGERDEVARRRRSCSRAGRSPTSERHEGQDDGDQVDGALGLGHVLHTTPQSGATMEACGQLRPASYWSFGHKFPRNRPQTRHRLAQLGVREVRRGPEAEEAPAAVGGHAARPRAPAGGRPRPATRGRGSRRSQRAATARSRVRTARRAGRARRRSAASSATWWR